MNYKTLCLILMFIMALILSIVPFPYAVATFRPPWILLLILYVEYFLPRYFKLWALLVIGILLDVLLNTIIGEHVFSLILVTWLASTYSRRFQFFSMLQQVCFIGSFCFFYQICLSFINGLLGYHYSLLMPLASGLVGMAVWPWLRFLADDALSKSALSLR